MDVPGLHLHRPAFTAFTASASTASTAFTARPLSTDLSIRKIRSSGQPV